MKQDFKFGQSITFSSAGRAADGGAWELVSISMQATPKRYSNRPHGVWRGQAMRVRTYELLVPHCEHARLLEPAQRICAGQSFLRSDSLLRANST